MSDNKCSLCKKDMKPEVAKHFIPAMFTVREVVDSGLFKSYELADGKTLDCGLFKCNQICTGCFNYISEARKKNKGA